MKRLRSNPFLAKPDRFRGRQQIGVRSHPGFHTTGSKDIAAAYAQAKAELPGDFPVILGFDMDGLDYTSDYDADLMAMSIRDNFGPEGLETFEDFIISAETLADSGFDDEHPAGNLEPGAPGQDILFSVDSAYHREVEKFAQHVIDLDEVDQIDAWRRVRDDSLAGSSLLADALDQRRYLDDIPDERLVLVEWVAPVWELVADSYDHEGALGAFLAALDSLGFVTVTTADLNDIEDGRVVRTTRAWLRRGKAPDRLQYHGTSWRNLIAAAPRFRNLIPPSPFGISYEDAVSRALEAVHEEFGPDFEYEAGRLYRPR